MVAGFISLYIVSSIFSCRQTKKFQTFKTQADFWLGIADSSNSKTLSGAEGYYVDVKKVEKSLNAVLFWGEILEYASLENWSD